MTPRLTGELLRPLITTQEQTACGGPCARPLLSCDLNAIITPDYDETECTVGFTVRLLCDFCARPQLPGQRRRLHSV